MSKQTALQALIEWAISLKDREQQCTDWIVIKHKAEELLLMEKEQIMDAVNDSWNMAKHSNFADAQAEQYYNEIYGGDK